MKFSEIKSTHLIILVAIIVIVMGAVQIYQTNRQNELLQSIIMSQLRGAKDGQKGEDPYEQSVKNQILKTYPEINALYKTYLAKKPAVKDGNIVVDFTIDTDGKAIDPQVVRSDIINADLQNGLKAIISRISFPEPMAKRYTTHTFRFKEEKKK